MTTPSKRKGNSYEREVVKAADSYGLDAKRAYASNGQALGESDEVDVKIENFRIQCKRRKKIASFLQIPSGADAVLFREDRGNTLVLITFEELLKLLHQRKYGHLPKRRKNDLRRTFNNNT